MPCGIIHWLCLPLKINPTTKQSFFPARAPHAATCGTPSHRALASQCCHTCSCRCHLEANPAFLFRSGQVSGSLPADLHIVSPRLLFFFYRHQPWFCFNTLLSAVVLFIIGEISSDFKRNPEGHFHVIIADDFAPVAAFENVSPAVPDNMSKYMLILVRL